MALKILSLNKFERINKYQPNYIAEAEFDGTSVSCEIYTNMHFYLNNGIYAMDHNFARSNGNLILRIESFKRFGIINQKDIENEFRKMIKGNGKK